jgi:hypothetical protein
VNGLSLIEPFFPLPFSPGGYSHHFLFIPILREWKISMLAGVHPLSAVNCFRKNSQGRKRGALVVLEHHDDEDYEAL